MSATESQKAAEYNKKRNEANINESGCFIALQTEMTIHPGPRNNQVILDTYMLESEIYLLYDKFLIDQAKSPLLNGLLPSLFA